MTFGCTPEAGWSGCSFTPGPMRYAAGAVNILNGNFVCFDGDITEFLPEHVMASGALPLALPMVTIGTDYFWDGGLVSNMPLQHLPDNAVDGPETSVALSAVHCRET